MHVCMQVHRSRFQELRDQGCGSKDGKPADGTTGDVPAAAEDNVESSVFYQSMMSWKNLQEWAQRAWAKHYHQSPGGSTQNVKPIIVQGGLGVEYISSTVESSPSDQNAPPAEVETSFGCLDNPHPANQQSASVGQNPAMANQNETSNVTANQSSVLASQSEVYNVTAGRGSGCISCHGDTVNKLNLRNQPESVQSPIERDLLAAARHREKLAIQARHEQTGKTGKKSHCTLSICLCNIINDNNNL